MHTTDLGHYWQAHVIISYRQVTILYRHVRPFQIILLYIYTHTLSRTHYLYMHTWSMAGQVYHFTYLSRGVLLRARCSHFCRHTTRLSYDRRRTTNRSKGHPSRSWIDLSRSPDLHVTGVAQSPSNLVYIPTNCKDPCIYIRDVCSVVSRAKGCLTDTVASCVRGGYE